MSTNLSASDGWSVSLARQSDSHPLFNEFFDGTTDRDMRLVLLGRTGEGKSALANVLTGTKNFKASCSMGSVTQLCQYARREFDGRNLLVIDTPGLFDTSTDTNTIAKEITKAVGISFPGPHAFLIVIKAGGGRYTHEAEETVTLVQNIFGGDIVRYCIVVFTGEDNIRRDDPTTTLDQWLNESTGPVKNLVKACNNRCVAVDTTEKAKEQLNVKVRELMAMVNKMVETNGGRVYTNDMLKRAEEAFKKREEEMLRAQHAEEERSQRVIDQLQQQIAKEELERKRLNNKVELMAEKSDKDHNELLAKRSEADRLAKQLDLLKRRHQEEIAKARDVNRESVQQEKDSTWEEVVKQFIPSIGKIVAETFNTLKNNSSSEGGNDSYGRLGAPFRGGGHYEGYSRGGGHYGGYSRGGGHYDGYSRGGAH
ncbi:unnamed protein product [Adineta steineri]|uniref:AIG1-type G domain-containing protein n=1 Tax=Adineta steineri TaxID=433720 RepID=A0A819KF25_9BILA|nr:unnamed protein product [Adineta steineri]CAF3945941.1 unnamed protein product [Adineta steineri]